MIRYLIISAFMAVAGVISANTNEKEKIATDGRYLLYVDSADRFLRAGRWIQAEDMIRNALRTSPANPCNAMLFSNLGVCLAAQNRYDEALEAYEISLIREPDSPVTLSSRGRTYLAMNKQKEAVEDFTRALELDSTMHQTRELRAKIYLTEGNVGAAENDFRSLMRQRPNDYTGPEGLGQCAELKGDYPVAAKYYRDASTLAKTPESQAEMSVALARCLIETDSLNEADDVVREGIRLYPRHGMLYLMRGWLHRLRYQNEEEKIDKKLAKEYGVDPQIIELYLPE